MKSIELTKKQARQVILAHQSLFPPRKLMGKSDILEYIRRVGCIQYDPLNKVGRNPDLVLQSRIKNYHPRLLEELLYTDRKLLDGWDKNMAIYSIEDWPFFHRYREQDYHRYSVAFQDKDEVLTTIREEIKEKGPISSGDLRFDTKIDWAWAPTRTARAALESMYFWGELIIHHKAGTRKFYDFADKHLPKYLLQMLDPNKTIEDFFEWMVKRRIGSIGLLWNRAGDAWLGTQWLKGAERTEAFSNLLEKGEIHKATVEEIKHPFYFRKEEEELVKKVIEGIKINPKASFIAPLDNLIWERRLIQEIFDFEYKWEVYTPIPERKYGYYVLPVVYGDRFVARFEPVFDKNTKELVIENWWWEPKVTQSKQIKRELTTAMKQFMKYLGAKGITLNNQAKELIWLVESIE